jgi:hypothetical protein
MFLGCLNACLVQPVISVERGVFYRERAAGYYACLPVSLARILASAFGVSLLLLKLLMPQLQRQCTWLCVSHQLPVLFYNAVLGSPVPD